MRQVWDFLKHLRAVTWLSYTSEQKQQKRGGLGYSQRIKAGKATMSDTLFCPEENF